MKAERAAEILRALADGLDPFTGEVLDDGSPLQNPECIRALFAAIETLEGRSSDLSTGWNVADLAKHHQRTRGAVRARLVRLGKINNRGGA